MFGLLVQDSNRNFRCHLFLSRRMIYLSTSRWDSIRNLEECTSEKKFKWLQNSVRIPIRILIKKQTYFFWQMTLKKQAHTFSFIISWKEWRSDSVLSWGCWGKIAIWPRLWGCWGHAHNRWHIQFWVSNHLTQRGEVAIWPSLWGCWGHTHNWWHVYFWVSYHLTQAHFHICSWFKMAVCCIICSLLQKSF